MVGVQLEPTYTGVVNAYTFPPSEIPFVQQKWRWQRQSVFMISLSWPRTEEAPVKCVYLPRLQPNGNTVSKHCRSQNRRDLNISVIVTIVDQISRGYQGRPRCVHYARPLIELLRMFCRWIDQIYATRSGKRGKCVETFMWNVAGNGSFLWLGQPGSNVVYAEGASVVTLLRGEEKKRGKCVKAQHFQWDFQRFLEKSSLYAQAQTHGQSVRHGGCWVEQEMAPTEPLFVGTPWKKKNTSD